MISMTSHRERAAIRRLERRNRHYFAFVAYVSYIAGIISCLLIVNISKLIDFIKPYLGL